MNRIKKIIAVGCIAAMTVSIGACSTNAEANVASMISGTEVTGKTPTNTAASTTAENLISEITEYTDATPIILGETVSSKALTVEGSKIKIIAGGKYTVTGTLANGQLEVNTTEKVHLELNEVDITNPTGPALLITDAKKVTITMAEGTTNKFTDGGKDEELDSAIFSNDTLVIDGKGTLLVAGNNAEGIGSDDDIIINSGTVKVTAVDDGINAHDDITINGGYVYVSSEGDGIDSNGTVNITGGMVISLSGITDANGGLDSDGEVLITGGTVIVTGSRLSTPSTNSTQKSIVVNASSTQDGKSAISIKQGEEELVTFLAGRSYQQLLFSSPELADDVSYDAYIGGTTTGEAVDGVYSDATYTGGTVMATVTTSDIISNNMAGGPGGGLGGKGGAPGEMPEGVQGERPTSTQ